MDVGRTNINYNNLVNPKYTPLTKLTSSYCEVGVGDSNCIARII